MKQKEYSDEKTVYILGIISICVILVFFLILYCLNIDIFHINLPCQIYSATGFYCPGCGGTRAFKYLLQGDILKSLKYHPFVIYAVGMGSVYMILNTISLLRGKGFSGMRVKSIYFLLAPIIIVGQFLIKNLIILLFGIKII